MRKIATYVENNVGMAFDHWTAAWTFELELWGLCGQGPDEQSALADLHQQIAVASNEESELVVTERTTAAQTGEELVFSRDQEPCTQAERQATVAILADIRPRTIALVSSCPVAVLDWDDPDRVLPSYASWRTVRQLAWHMVDTESRYYLPCTGLGYRASAQDLVTELHQSAAHVRSVLETMPADLLRTSTRNGTWTSVKLLRRLAWHERGELPVMHQLAAHARTALNNH